MIETTSYLNEALSLLSILRNEALCVTSKHRPGLSCDRTACPDTSPALQQHGTSVNALIRPGTTLPVTGMPTIGLPAKPPSCSDSRLVDHTGASTAVFVPVAFVDPLVELCCVVDIGWKFGGNSILVVAYLNNYIEDLMEASLEVFVIDDLIEASLEVFVVEDLLEASSDEFDGTDFTFLKNCKFIILKSNFCVSVNPLKSDSTDRRYKRSTSSSVADDVSNFFNSSDWKADNFFSSQRVL
ncbi:hypothetical protein J6590_105422 [Homalodisca vitripennis]|nr:hypothetical protein J6590_105422 [Homalodisca vitripennis]